MYLKYEYAWFVMYVGEPELQKIGIFQYYFNTG